MVNPVLTPMLKTVVPLPVIVIPPVTRANARVPDPLEENTFAVRVLD